MLSKRQEEILRRVVERYIPTARPVSSSTVCDDLSVAVSPATVRAELQNLEELGYLYQPHTSAGRIPTDMGYRYFVDHLRDRAVSVRQQEQMAEELRELRERYHYLAQATAKLLSHMAHTAVVSSVPKSRTSHVSGLKELFAGPEGTVAEAMREMSSILDAVSEEASELAQQDGDTPLIYIGSEIPFWPAAHTSIMAQQVNTARDDSMMVIIVGPKRMPYQRNRALLQAVKNVLHKFEDYDE